MGINRVQTDAQYLLSPRAREQPEIPASRHPTPPRTPRAEYQTRRRHAPPLGQGVHRAQGRGETKWRAGERGARAAAEQPGRRDEARDGPAELEREHLPAARHTREGLGLVNRGEFSLALRIDVALVPLQLCSRVARLIEVVITLYVYFVAACDPR